MKRILLLCAIIGTFSFLPAQDSDNDPSRWTPEDIVYTRMERLGSAVFSPDGSRIVTASLDKTVRIWNTDGSGVVAVLRGSDAPVNRASFAPDGTQRFFTYLGGGAHDRAYAIQVTDEGVKVEIKKRNDEGGTAVNCPGCLASASSSIDDQHAVARTPLVEPCDDHQHHHADYQRCDRSAGDPGEPVV